MEELTAVMYVRVSSKEQAEGHFSIPAQIDFLQQYAKEKGFKVLKIYQESFSAKEKGRPIFDDMVRFLKKQKKTCRLLVEKNDRLLRNEDDAALTINLALKTETEIHLVKDNMVLSKNSTPHEIMIYTIMCATSSWYPRNLSREVTKGMNKKADMGYYPAQAPVGYINKRENKKVSHIIVDTEKAHFIKKAFELYSTGAYSYQSLADRLAADGFIIRTRPCQKNNIEKILKNPFYIGDFNYKMKRYFDGKHEPLISRELYSTVQNIINRHATPKLQKNDFVYSGLIKCSKCGSYLVGDLKKGKYLYFRCMHRGCTVKKHLKAEYVDNIVSEILSRMAIPEEVKIGTLKNIKHWLMADHEYRMKNLEKLNDDVMKLKKRLNQLYIDKIDGVVDTEFYLENKNEWGIELDKLLANQNEMSHENEEIMQRAEELLELCQKAPQWYSCQTAAKKRIFLKLICSNFYYDGEKCTVTIKSALKTMFESTSSNMVGVIGQSSKNEAHKNNILQLIRKINEPETVTFIDTFKNLLAA